MCFMPAAAVAWKFEIPPGIYLAGFIALSLVYWSSFRTQVPLFLSNRATGYRLAAWIPAYGDIRLLDLGSGTGCLVAQLCELRPDWRITGIESAPAPYWWSRWSTRDLAGANLIRDDFWRHSLQTYDVVYAFLSPVPMSALWRKALKEMRPGTWLVSNSFAIDGVQESALLGVGDRRGTQLYCYQIPQRGRLAGSKRKNSRISQNLLPDDHAP